MTTSTAFRGAARAAAYLETDTPPAAAAEPAKLEPEVVAAEPSAEPPAEPDPATLDLESLVEGEPAAVARSGLRGVLARTGIKVPPSRSEQARLAEAETLRRHEELIRQSTWLRAVGILVANRKGGVGKTPTSIVLGGTLAAIRGGSVAIMEVADDPGTLTFRAEGTPQRGIGQLVVDHERIVSAGQLASYTAPQTSYASVIGTVGIRPQLDANDVRNAAAVIDQHYAIRVMDSGNQPSSSAFEGALAATDVLVIPVLNTVEAVMEATALLDLLRASGSHSRRLAHMATVLRLTDGRPESPELLAHLDEHLQANRVAQVFEIPYDPHIASRGPITLDRLAPATRAAFTRAGAGIVRTLRDQPIDIQK
jgi:MinD-like ATPase involved in chromosome partitioning or flagellar assembly